MSSFSNYTIAAGAVPASSGDEPAVMPSVPAEPEAVGPEAVAPVAVTAPLSREEREQALSAQEFVIHRELDAGGMGQVYLVSDEGMHPGSSQDPDGLRFVLKLLRPDRLGDPSAVARFHKEICAAVFCDHDNVLRPMRIGQLPDGSLFYTTRYMAGGTLDDRLDASRTDVSIRHDSLAALVPVLDALHHLHSELDLVHRDVKPANIFFTAEGKVNLGDLGIVRTARSPEPGTSSASSMGVAVPDLVRTQADRMVGTVHFMSPEVIAGRAPDGASDQYAVGVIAYRLLTGRYPHEASSSQEVLRFTRDSAVLDPSQVEPRLDLGLKAVVLKLLANHPGDRYPTALEAASALKTALEAAPRGGLHPSAVVPPPPVPLDQLARLDFYLRDSDEFGTRAFAALPFALDKDPPSVAERGGTPEAQDGAPAGEDGPLPDAPSSSSPRWARLRAIGSFISRLWS